jgi:phosphoribosylformylglycinamidine (FGAM) synthase-like enzyme
MAAIVMPFFGVEWDLVYYTDLFRNKLRRNPTSVECFDMAQSNSEHSRHWFFCGGCSPVWPQFVMGTPDAKPAGWFVFCRPVDS